MATRTKPLRSSAGRNSRKRPPLDPDHVAARPGVLAGG